LDQAIQKIELLAKTTTSTDTRQRIDALLERLRNAHPSEITSPDAGRRFVAQYFLPGKPAGVELQSEWATISSIEQSPKVQIPNRVAKTEKSHSSGEAGQRHSRKPANNF